MELFHTANYSDHFGFAKHQIAEEKQIEYSPKHGEIISWKRKHQQNHWLDALTYACVAGSIAGVKLVTEIEQATQPARLIEQKPQPLFNVSSDGSPFFVLER
jgi:hypothetical protein